MKLWKLTPVNLNDPGWNRSAYKGEVVVRAKSNADARDVAYRAFVDSDVTHHELGPCPWETQAQVDCTGTPETSDYTAVGAPVVVWPVAAVRSAD
jgi:hypothetical protein